MTRLFGWLLGIDQASSIEEVNLALAAPWVQGNLFWLLAIIAILLVLGVVFYRRLQARGSARWRTVLGVVRGLLLSLLVLTLAAPVLRMTLTSVRSPTLFLVFDGTDSMGIQDPWTDEQRRELRAAVGGDENQAAGQPVLNSRLDYLKALVARDKNNLLQQLQEQQGVRIEAFQFDGHATSHLRRLAGDPGAKVLPKAQWAEQLTATGQVTALGSVLRDLREQSGSANLAAVVLFSDFAHNSGASPLGEGARSPLRIAGIPIHTVGLGAIETLDVAVDLQTDLKMKKAERSSVLAKIRQTGLQGRPAQVRLVARRLGGIEGVAAPEVVVGETTVTLNSAVETAEFPFTPQESGLFEFALSVEPLEGEVVRENNVAKRQVNIIDDYLRLMYVAYEPDWEWRFVKEVFHRDKLVGLDGFRTFLGSSDPRVRETNVLFLETLTPKRSEFFRQDVLFLGDMPGAALTTRFSEMVKEFVGNLGGGLVVIAGPRFGPAELKDSPLADLLPVVIDPQARLKDDKSFRLRRTAYASAYPFMRLGESDPENERAWNNLQELPWYQPVAALRDQAVVLAEHPTDKLADGKTPQPLIAVRQFGRGEVVYLGFNELWRLRRKHGEQYYRQFWSQLIYRLGMSHALGAAKRFVPRLDRPVYRVEEQAVITVEAYDENYEPLTAEDLTAGGLKAELIAPAREGGSQVTALTIPLLRQGVCETRVPLYAAGEYALRVTDPVTGQIEERRFEVTDSSAERRRAVRDLRLQEEIARQSGGRSYDLQTVANLARDLKLTPTVERSTRSHPLWNTPLWFGLVVGLMVCEWGVRKWLFLN